MKRLLIVLLIICSFQSSGQNIYTIAGCSDTARYCCDDGPATLAKLAHDPAIYVDKYNNIYIADALNSRVRKVDAITHIITTIAGVDTMKVDGTYTYGFSGDSGLATNAELWVPESVFNDTAGNIYISDGGNNRIRKVTISTGIITTIAGSGPIGTVINDSGDGGQR